jgi:hypothetical protein
MLKKWMTSLVLILVLVTGVVAGVPIHFGGRGLQDMDKIRRWTSPEKPIDIL